MNLPANQQQGRPLHIHSIGIPNDELVKLSLEVYKPSIETISLKSENMRTVFAEEFNENFKVLPLQDLSLIVLGNHYKGGPIPAFIHNHEVFHRRFYEYVSVDLNLLQCIDIGEKEVYWKRVFLAKCKDKMLAYAKQHDASVNWKNLSIAIKYLDVIENHPYEVWIEDEMRDLTQRCKQFILELHIHHLQAMREKSFQRYQESESESESEHSDDERGEEEPQLAKPVKEEKKRYDYPAEHCHHIDLRVLGILENLTSLTIEFLPPELGITFQSRMFNFSYVDVQNLAKALTLLQKLKIFRIRHSRMDAMKLAILVQSLKYLSVEHLEFAFCQLKDDCGDSLYGLLEASTSIKHLQLKGNFLIESAVELLAEGVLVYQGSLEYLGLAENQISEKGLQSLITALITSRHVKHLCLSGMQITDKGIACIAEQLLKSHLPLEQLEMIATPLGNSPATDDLMKAIEENTKIHRIEFRGCKLTAEQEFQIQLFLKRNQHIRENPYIGDETKTAEEINNWINRVKNPILLRALEEVEKRKNCLRNMSKYEISLPTPDRHFHQNSILMSASHSRISTISPAKSDRSFTMPLSNTEPTFNFDPTNFDENGFLRHVNLFKPIDRKFFASTDKR